MTDKEKIKQEILRRKKTWSHQDKQYERGGRDLCDYLLGFIDSLPEEHASEDLEKGIGYYTTSKLLKKRDHSTGVYHLTQRECDDIARHFAEWQRNQIMKDVVSTTIVNDWQYGKDPDHAIIPAIHQRIDGFDVGERVKFIVVKED